MGSRLVTRDVLSSRVIVTSLIPFSLACVIDISAVAVGADEMSTPAKLLLMPLLALAFVLSIRGIVRGVAPFLLLLALLFSWLGDSASVFFPAMPEIPVMVTWFGLAHASYIYLFRQYLAVRPLPRLTLGYAVWWIAFTIIFAPVLLKLEAGPLWLVGIAAYGLLLGASASYAAMGGRLTGIGAALFLFSDSVLAFREFRPGVLPPEVAGTLVMVLYCTGQALIVVGALHNRRLRSSGKFLDNTHVEPPRRLT